MPDLHKTVEKMEEAAKAELKERAAALKAENPVDRIMGMVAMPKDTIAQAMKSEDVNVTLIKELWILQQEFDAAQASRDFFDAMSEFKRHVPAIDKTATARTKLKSGQVVERKYADLADVCEALAYSMAREGLSYNWGVTQDKNLITVTCYISHKGGHTIMTSISGQPDATGYKNAIQAIGSTIEYLKRYTLLALSGVPTKGLDDDGGRADEENDDDSTGGALVHETQIKSFKNLMGSVGVEEAELLEELKLPALADIQAQDFGMVVNRIKKLGRAK